ncbi:MAG: FtsW/RodA/SpoVE family cell cycle protein [Phycisphaeraceae bacterium]|nr:MAG: FtsW/RodA/SpoVE family cell cycle protein [Phycisphaeraceae bacterium]
MPPGSAVASTGLGEAFRRVADPRNPAWVVVLASALLCAAGLYGIDLAENLRPGEASPAARGVLFRQIVYLAVGVLAAVVVCVPHYRWLGYLSNLAAVPVVALLIFLLIPAVPSWLVTPRNGARGWINLGISDFQPAELAKVVYVLVIARYLRFRRTHRSLRGLLPIAAITAVPVGLITLQPDLGTALLFIPALFAVLAAAGARLKHLVVIVAIGAAAAPLSYPVLKPHQQQRIIGLWKQFTGDTSADRDINFQSAAAKTLIGAGGLAGVSDLKSRAYVHYSALPERHNDMIVSVLVNRFGLVGLLAIVGLYIAWAGGAFLAAARTPDPFARLLAVGLAAFIGTQAFVNIAMNLGIAPIVGITLPFVSFGGSSMLSAWIMTGLIVSITVHAPERQLRHAFEFRDE